MKLFKFIILPLVLLLAGCATPGTGGTNESNKIEVVTTFYPVYEFTSKVVGENGTVTALLNAGQDSHGYEPTPKDLATIAEADVFIYSSAYMETWVPTVLESLTDTDVKIIEATEGLPFFEGEEEHEDDQEEDHSDHSHAVDPHVWLDPTFAEHMVTVIAEGIQEVDSEQADIYKENAAAYREELQTLDQEFEAAFADAKNRMFVVQHAAFGYLARRYQLEEVPISSTTSNQEASPAQLAETGAFIEANQITTIYYQDSANAQLAETLAAETNTELAELSSIEGVTEEDQASGVDYLSLMRANLEALQLTIK